MGFRIEVNADFCSLIGTGKLVGEGYNIDFIRIGLFDGFLKGLRRGAGGFRSDGG